MSAIVLFLVRGFGWLLATYLFLAFLCTAAVDMFYPGGVRALLKRIEREENDKRVARTLEDKDARRRRKFFRR
jgi:hypothetical protein